MIRSIPTVYRDITYRSRTEARWAAFFDAVGMMVVYEPEGYFYDGNSYLPDFEIVDTMELIAIKPLRDLRAHTEGLKRELEWQKKMINEGTSRLWIIAGVPAPGQYEIVNTDGEIDIDALYRLVDCRKCNGLCVSNNRGDFGTLGAHMCGDRFKYSVEDERVRAAMRCAMKQQFGERKTQQQPTRPERDEQ